MPTAERRRLRPPNGELRALLGESGLTQEALARAVGRVAAEAGVRLSYDRTSVARWLRGSRPSPQVRGFLAEALARRLGRPVTAAQLGMGGGQSGTATAPAPSPAGAAVTAPAAAPAAPPAQAASAAPSSAAPSSARPPAGAERLTDRLAALTSAVVGPPRADPPPPAPYHLSTAPPPGSRPQPSCPAPRTSAHRTTPDEVASVREHARFFAQQADRHGGGHIRTSLAACLAAQVRRLRAGGEGPWHPRLVAGAARLSFLLARVYADEQRHGLAQRAFETAAQLAAEGDDPEGVALARRALSSQAYQLGHRRQSLALAESACASAPSAAQPSVRSFLFAGLAVARAANGERRHALAALSRAEHELALAPADLSTGPVPPEHSEPIGAYQDAALHYQAGQVRSALGDRDGAVRELRASLRSRPPGERRTRALSEAELAELLLAQGRLEESCTAWELFVEDSSLVRSGRTRRALARMPRLLRPYGQEPCVQSLLTRAGLPLRSPATE